MTTGLIAPAGDLDALFMARVGAAASNTGFLSNGGVDIAQRFEQRGATPAIAATGFIVNGVGDLNQIFKDIAAALSVQLLDGTAFSPAASGVTVTFANTGVFSSTGPVTGASTPWNWLLAGAASQVDIRATPTAGTFSSGSAASTWLNLATTRSWSLSWSGGMSTNSVTFTVELRNASTLAVLATMTFNMNTHP